MIVIFTHAAERDLEAIGDFISMSDPRRAASFVDALIDRCNLIADHPFAFSLVPRFESNGVRRRYYAKYLIFYRIRFERVEILRIISFRPRLRQAAFVSYAERHQA